MQDVRIQSAAYGVYVFVLAVVAFLGRWYVVEWRTAFDATNARMVEIQNNIIDIQTKTRLFDNNQRLIKAISTNSGTVINAFNQDSIASLNIPNLSSGEYGFVRSFLLLDTLQSAKMLIDEKKILTNINVFLLRSNPDDPDGKLGKPFGQIKSISIGKEKKFLDNLFEVPIRTSIEFANKDALLQFIKNVELRIPWPRLSEYRILYKIDSINYDLVRYYEDQQVDIVLKAYYFK